MEETTKVPASFDAVYNETEKRFEVWYTDPNTNIKALLLTQTHEDILQHLKNMMINYANSLNGAFPVDESSNES